MQDAALALVGAFCTKARHHSEEQTCCQNGHEQKRFPYASSEWPSRMVHANPWRFLRWRTVTFVAPWLRTV
jgi:hypothetical protein